MAVIDTLALFEYVIIRVQIINLTTRIAFVMRRSGGC